MSKINSVGRCEDCRAFYRVRVPHHGSACLGTRGASPVRCPVCGGNVRRSTVSAYHRAVRAASPNDKLTSVRIGGAQAPNVRIPAPPDDPNYHVRNADRGPVNFDETRPPTQRP